MKRVLKSPSFNAVCIILFSTFYSLMFMTHTANTEFKLLLRYEGSSAVWKMWSNFLIAGYQIYMVWLLIAVTIFVAVLLLIRHRSYDEYHTNILTYCLVVAAVLTLFAIAIFYWVILSEPIWIAGKFMLFIMIHWTTVVFANLVYILICRWR